MTRQPWERRLKVTAHRTISNLMHPLRSETRTEVCAFGDTGVPGVMNKWDGLVVEIPARGVVGMERMVMDIPGTRYIRGCWGYVEPLKPVENLWQTTRHCGAPGDWRRWISLSLASVPMYRMMAQNLNCEERHCSVHKMISMAIDCVRLRRQGDWGGIRAGQDRNRFGISQVVRTVRENAAARRLFWHPSDGWAVQLAASRVFWSFHSRPVLKRWA